MNLTAQLTALREETRELTRVERARRCCDLAKQLEKAGEYDAACEALSEFWPERDRSLNLNDLDEATTGEVLLRAGALAGWLGSTDQTEGSQETAKDLITQSIDLFQELGLSERVAEARGDLALCYWREGSYDEARITLADSISFLGNENSDLKAALLIRAGIIEERTRRLHEALRLYNEAAPLLKTSEDHALMGAFHNEFGLVFKHLSTPENRQDYLDRALMEYTAASFHFEQAGNTRYLARVENNLGCLFFKSRKYGEAHKHLGRARHFFMDLKDMGMIAQVDDTRARTLLAEGRVAEAERVVRYAVRILKRGDEQAVLAEALTTHGVALARLGDHSSARRLLQRAIEVAETAGDLEGGGRAKLSIIEELFNQNPEADLAANFLSAANLLQHSQDPSTKERLISCARKMIESFGAGPVETEAAKITSWKGFSLKQAVLKTEKAIIERALKEAGGSVSKAARLLGLRSHQSLISTINVRHRDLLAIRSPVRKRRRSLSSRQKKGRRRGRKRSPAQRASAISILHVEDNVLLANLIADMFVEEEWRIELCTDGDSALRKLTGSDHYDLLLFDYELPGLNGLELVKRARNITHRRRTPIIMLSASNCEKEAWRAGADAFLKKPEQIDELQSTVARLLEDGSKHS
jgi:CheY-like chemotaxis protein